ncbi:MAG: hypothetical protein AAGU19_14405 [Prolixibacteraceae bacterium]
MKRSVFLLLCPFAFLIISCNYREAEDPVNTSYAFPEDRILLGGVVAEQFSGPNLTDSSRLHRPSQFAERIAGLQKKAAEMKQEQKSLDESFYGLWQEVSNEITWQFENLSNKDITSWVTLNDSLLKYSGEQRFAEELEKMVYNAPVPQIITEAMIKSFCYTRLYDRIYVNLFGSSYVQYTHTTGGNVRIVQDTDYPFEGRILLKVELDDTRFLDLFIRIPGWSKQSSVVMKGVQYNTIPGEYTEVARKWKNGDMVEIKLSLKPEVIRNESSAIAFTYGPLLLSYLHKPGKEMVFRSSAPLSHLQPAATEGQIPTFVFTGISDETLILQPFSTEDRTDSDRTAWITTPAR